jgi:hypothetical protein
MAFAMGAMGKGGTQGTTFRRAGLSHLDFFSAVTGPSWEQKTGSGRYRHQNFLRKKPGAA